MWILRLLCIQSGYCAGWHLSIGTDAQKIILGCLIICLPLQLHSQEKLRHNVFSYRRAVTQILGGGRAFLVLETPLTWLRWSRGWSPRLDKVEAEGTRPCSGLGENWTHGPKGFLWPEAFLPTWCDAALPWPDKCWKSRTWTLDANLGEGKRQALLSSVWGFLKNYFYKSQIKNNTILTSPKIIWWPDGVISKAIQEQPNT